MSEGSSSPKAQSRRGSFAPIEFTNEISKQCLKQVEFYFSEFNFPYDKFLRTTAEKNDGWVPITTIATFNRMKKYRPVDKVVEVLRTSKILEVSEDGENVKRTAPLDLTDARNTRIEQNKRTLAIMNFPTDEDDKLTFAELQDKIEEFINKVAEVNQVRLRRAHRKKFNGTVLVEFKSEEGYNDFLKNYTGEGAEILSYENRKLDVLTKKQFDLQREATKSKNFSGSGQRSRSFTGHRKNMPKLDKQKTEEQSDSAIEQE
ncbi:hypothetical protein Kpol_472p2 [Vanderwaltozyma polyspora DSM 70294]|uniref:HTH La-type RNA-binding domain-containing protein n=1 Tax=Vanderwaltozyma polyspora (strain ATCC 22028 / DSM 70294 / BCRC 21397 / CBS 2163 / NBRC 10782 / NRRL Y-8283 / UCD 57-17) TaxID=436907 RepID=A7TQH0_VANPO|nr:uncharacterized protein Kpol_472p2 [Vanderwaltozyma polyspora DSM 70294]EDO15471.1 hypothetical protein Kpol_472p2 [Vanderwaltozyma polyspora DSM 70294]